MFRATHTPPLSTLLEDLLTSDPAAIARHLDVSTRTFERWKQADQAPRAALLALFYESRWGYSLLETTAYNGHAAERAWRQGLQRENAMLRTRIARLESIGDFGAANAPAMTAQRQTGPGYYANISGVPLVYPMQGAAAEF
jgi:hypothetical protein